MWRELALALLHRGRNVGRPLVLHIDRVHGWRCAGTSLEAWALARRKAARNIDVCDTKRIGQRDDLIGLPNSRQVDRSRRRVLCGR